MPIKYVIPGPLSEIRSIQAVRCEEIGDSIILEGSKNRSPKIDLYNRYFGDREEAITEYLKELKRREEGARAALKAAVSMYKEVQAYKEIIENE